MVEAVRPVAGDPEEVLVFEHEGRYVVVLRVRAVPGQSVADAHAHAGKVEEAVRGRSASSRKSSSRSTRERGARPAADLLARADEWLEPTRADGELRAGWSRPTDAVIVIGSAQRLARPGMTLRRSTGGGAVSCDDRYLMLDVVLPRGHPLVIEDVGRSYRWLAKALLAALAPHGAELRA